ncbi:MAG: TonB-dependent receptor [Bryobacteraceae bacterium]
MRCLLLALACAAASAQEIRGRVADALTGEHLARAQIRVQGHSATALTAADGAFALAALAPGEYVLLVSTVGYRTAREPFTLAASEAKSFEILLRPELLRHNEQLQVTASAFPEGPEPKRDLTGGELRNLSTVFINDPLRAVQAMPSISSTDDFQSQFAVRGAGARRVGLYLDGVLLHSPFHTVQHDPASASIAIINGNVLESVELHAGPPPPAFADRTAGVLDLTMREGDRGRVRATASAGMASSDAAVEGPLGAHGHGSWLVSARKSYLQYIIDLTADDQSLAFGFTDASARLTYDVHRSHRLSLTALQGRSGLNRRDDPTSQSLNRLMRSDYQFTIGSLGWQYAPGAGFLLSNRLAWMRERSHNRNRLAEPLAEGLYAEWVWGVDGTRNITPAHALRFGATFRRQRDDAEERRFGGGARVLDRYRGSGVRSGAYAQHSWTTRRVQATAGARWDRMDVSGVNALSPYAALGLRAHERTRIRVAAGLSAQYPEIARLFSFLGSTSLLPERSAQITLGVDQDLGERIRLQADVYHRQDRDLLLRPALEARLRAGRVIDLNERAPVVNAGRGHARGIEILLQRRSANGLAGWISYSFGRARVRDPEAGVYPGDFDSRHAFRAFAAYRLRSTVSLGGRWISASGLPVPGYYLQPAPLFFTLGESRNQLRLPAYHRGDIRLNKDFQRDRIQWSLYLEVINLFNHSNVRFDDLNGYDRTTGVARLGFEELFPVLPSAGIVVRF